MAADEELMQRVARGELAAFGELFDRHQPPFYAFLCRLLGNPALADDAVQEVFLRIWRHRTGFEGRCSFRAWAYRIARNVALDEVRRRRHGTPLSQLSEEDQAQVEARPDGAPGPEAACGREMLRAQVRAALQLLPEEQRLCLILKEYEECSYREIGEIMGCTEATARVTAYRARQALRRKLHPALKGEEACV